MRQTIEVEGVSYNGEPSRGTGSVVTPTVEVTCECPVHGRFELRIEGDAPTEVSCTLTSWAIAGFATEYRDRAAAEDGVYALGMGLDEVRLETQKCAETAPVVTTRTLFVTRSRGEHGRIVTHDYECPHHGQFEARVESANVPDEMPCAAVVHDGHMDPPCCPREMPCEWHGVYCGMTSPWRAQRIAVGWSAGSVRS